MLRRTHLSWFQKGGGEEELDKIIKSDKSHAFENAKDALKGAVEGKLPVKMKDGKIIGDPKGKPLEFSNS